MAGRPASGGSGMLWGLIGFAFFSVVCLVMFVIMLTQNKSLQNRADDAERQLRQYGRPPSFYADEASRRNSTVFGVMNDDLERVAFVVTGARDDVGQAIEAKANRLLAQAARNNPNFINESDTLLTALERLSQHSQDLRGQVDALNIAVSDLQQELADETASFAAARSQFEEQSQQFADRVATLQEEKRQQLQQKEDQLGELRSAYEATEQQLRSLEREGLQNEQALEIEIGRLENQIDRLQGKLAEVQPDALKPRALLTSADGRILRAIPGSDVVYINLGKQDRIKPGMRFEVYSQTQEATGDSLRGKASVEVVTAMEETAECRVTRRAAGQPIIEGDIVVNIAYEQERRPKFVVRGQFDLDYDGVSDPNGVKQVTSLIEQWGGTVVSELDETVDYMVIGMPPGGPDLRQFQTVSEVVRNQALAAEFRRTGLYQEVDTAWKMYIPLLGQEQFLILTGYTGQGPVMQ